MITNRLTLEGGKKSIMSYFVLILKSEKSLPVTQKYSRGKYRILSRSIYHTYKLIIIPGDNKNQTTHAKL